MQSHLLLQQIMILHFIISEEFTLICWVTDIDWKAVIKSTLVFSEEAKDLWTSLLNLTSLVYKELEGNKVWWFEAYA